MLKLPRRKIERIRIGLWSFRQKGKSATLKLSDLRACDNCGGKLTGEEGRNITFYIVRVTMAVLNPRAINQVMGLHQYFQGKAFALAEVMAPESDHAVELVAEQEGGKWAELLICFDCAAGNKRFVLLEVVERISK